MIHLTFFQTARRWGFAWAVLPGLLLGSAVAQGAEGESSDPVTRLAQEYEAALVKYVDTPHKGAQESLVKSYVAALERLQGQAQTAGDLEAVLALRGEAERCQKGRALPKSDEGVHSALQGPRKALREKLGALEERRVKQYDAVTKSYESRMARLEGVLAKSRRIDDALRVREMRNTMTASLSAPAVVAPKEPEGPPAEPVISVAIPRPDAEGWITVLDHNRLYGSDPKLEQIEDGRARFEDGLLRLDKTSVPIFLEAKNLIINAEVKKDTGQNLSISFRANSKGAYSAWHNGGESFGIGRNIDGWENIRNSRSSPSNAEFQEYEIRVDDEDIELWVNGEQIAEIEDDQIRKKGTLVLGAHKGVSYFRRVRVKVLN